MITLYQYLQYWGFKLSCIFLIWKLQIILNGIRNKLHKFNLDYFYNVQYGPVFTINCTKLYHLFIWHRMYDFRQQYKWIYLAIKVAMTLCFENYCVQTIYETQRYKISLSLSLSLSLVQSIIFLSCFHGIKQGSIISRTLYLLFLAGIPIQKKIVYC